MRKTSFTPELRTELAARYEAGETIKALAASYGVGKETIMRHLVRAGVQTRRRGLTDEQASEAKRLYEDGATIAAIATKLGAAFSTVQSSLVRQGVAMRPRGGWGSRGGTN